MTNLEHQIEEFCKLAEEKANLETLLTKYFNGVKDALPIFMDLLQEQKPEIAERFTKSPDKGALAKDETSIEKELIKFFPNCFIKFKFDPGQIDSLIVILLDMSGVKHSQYNYQTGGSEIYFTHIQLKRFKKQLKDYYNYQALDEEKQSIKDIVSKLNASLSDYNNAQGPDYSKYKRTPKDLFENREFSKKYQEVRSILKEIERLSQIVDYKYRVNSQNPTWLSKIIDIEYHSTLSDLKKVRKILLNLSNGLDKFTWF